MRGSERAATHRDHKHLKTAAPAPHFPQHLTQRLALRTHLVTACGINRKFHPDDSGGESCLNERGSVCRKGALLWEAGSAGGHPSPPNPPQAAGTPSSTSWPPASVCEPIKKRPLFSVWKLLQGKFAAPSWLLTRVLIRGLSRLWLERQCHLEEQLEAAVRRRIILMNTFPFNCMGISRSH